MRGGPGFQLCPPQPFSPPPDPLVLAKSPFLSQSSRTLSGGHNSMAARCPLWQKRTPENKFISRKPAREFDPCLAKRWEGPARTAPVLQHEWPALNRPSLFRSTTLAATFGSLRIVCPKVTTTQLEEQQFLLERLSEAPHRSGRSPLTATSVALPPPLPLPSAQLQFAR
jgi:hypothetical protein